MTDHQKLFALVVEANTTAFINGTTQKAFNYSILQLDKSLTENEVRYMAVRFFNASLSEELNNRLKDQVKF